jgi:cytochrome c oxidase subunit 2
MKSRFLIVGLAIALFIITGYIVQARLNAEEPEQVIRIKAKRFEYSPKNITVKKGVPVVLEFTSEDRMHGFSCPGLKIRGDVRPGQTTQVRFVPQEARPYLFHCDNFCGSGHEGMTGTITVTE